MEYTNRDEEEIITTPLSEISMKKEPLKKAKYKELYALLPKTYKLLFYIGCICAFAGGSSYPATVYIRQKIFDKFNEDDRDDLHDSMVDDSWLYVGIAGISLITNFIHYTCFTLIGKKITYELRWRYIKAILRQDSAWFDAQTIESIPPTIHQNLKDIEIGSGRVIGFIIFSLGSFLFGVGITFGIAWLYSFILFGFLVYMIIMSKSVQAILDKVQSKTQNAYEKCGVQAEETINAIRVVKAFRQERTCSTEFSSHLQKKRKEIMSMSSSYAGAFAWLETVGYVPYGYALLIGGFLVSERVSNSFSGEPYNGGDVFISGSFLTGNYFLGHSVRNSSFLNKALEAAYPIFEVINRVPDINLDDESASDITEIANIIEFQNIEFKYPNAKKNALKGVSFTINKGQTLALVGPSGSGKSTIARLLERFYDPDNGSVIIDGKDLKSINLRKYRHLVGYVGQEPCLFNETIRENMLNSDPDATEKDIIRALKRAHAWSFVEKLGNGIDHSVGAIGCKLSGGQKQRIAIARALVRNPQLLIFDEATSALDIKSEKEVQQAIDSIEGDSITKVVIAHRLTTVKNADTILVLEDGKIVEQGNNEELMRINQLYARMKKIQDEANRTKEINSENFKDKVLPEEGEGTGDNKVEADKKTEEVPLLFQGYDTSNALSEDNFSGEENSFIFATKQIYRFVAPKWYLIFIFLGALSLSCIFIMLPYQITKLIMKYIESDTGTEVKNSIAIYIPIIFGMCILSSIIQFICKKMLFRVNTNITENVRCSLYDNIIKQPIQFFDKRNHSTGNLTAILSASAKELDGASIEMYVFIIQAFSGVFGGVIFCYIFVWNIGLILTALAPISGFTLAFTLLLQSSFKAETKEVESKQEKMISDYILNYTTVGSLANEKFMAARYFSDSNSPEGGSKLKAENFYEAIFPAIGYGLGFSIFIFTMGMVSLIAAHNIKSGHTIEDQAMGVMGFSYSYLTIAFIMTNPPDFGRGIIAIRKIASILNHTKEGEPQSSIINGSSDLHEEVGNDDIIEFHNVWFKYPSSKKSNWVLENFNLKINQGERIGFVGESGCGKSTIVALLMRFYDPQDGYISIGGRDIREFTLDSLRAHFGFVQQEPILFNTTIMENISYGKPYATAEEIESASKQAYCHDFIVERAKDVTSEAVVFDEESQDNRLDNLDKGYRALCGSRGSYLSGGQKQRIAIARAIIGNPRVLILDEATSALDEESQKEVQSALDEVTKKCASIVIAHRPSTLQMCDRIVTIERGVIVNEVSTDSE